MYISLSICTFKCKMYACTISVDEFAPGEDQELREVAPFDLLFFRWEARPVVPRPRKEEEDKEHK